MDTNLFKPTYLRKLCEVAGLRPSKAYGQNYLISQKPIQEILAAGELTKEDTIVEVGPGFGVLTLAMAAHVGKVHAFEIEKKLTAYWEERQKEYGNVEIVWGNALKELPTASNVFPSGYKVLANLPYQVTSKLLRTLLELENKPERVVVMVQKEVAERMCAKAGDMSLLAVSVQYYGMPKIVTKVPSGNFWPAPKVDSAVVAITDIYDKPNAEQFFRMARAGFASKRKQLWKNLSSGLKLDGALVKQALMDVVGNEKVRAEELSVADWEQLQDRLEIGD